MNLADKSFSTTKLMAIAGVTLASVVATMAPAAAVVNVTVNGQEYVVDNLPAGSFTSQESLLRAQPWWGSSTNADAFASAVGSRLGFPNFDSVAGPLFAYEVNGFGVTGIFFVSNTTTDTQVNTADTSISYATATPVPLESDGWAVLLSTTALGLGVKLKQLKNKKKIDLEE